MWSWGSDSQISDRWGRALSFPNITPVKFPPRPPPPRPRIVRETSHTHRYRAFCQTLEQEFHLGGENGYEKFQPQEWFSLEAVMSTWKQGFIMEVALQTVTSWLQTCDPVLKYKHCKKKHLNGARKDRRDRCSSFPRSSPLWISSISSEKDTQVSWGEKAWCKNRKFGNQRKINYEGCWSLTGGGCHKEDAITSGVLESSPGFKSLRACPGPLSNSQAWSQRQLPSHSIQV